MQLPSQRQSKTEALRETEQRHERMPTLAMARPLPRQFQS